MTASAAWARPGAAERWTAVDLFAFVCGVVVILIFSQGWVTALGGDNPDSASGLLRAMAFPGYAAGLALIVLSPGETARALLRQPLLIVLMWVVAASFFWSIDPGETARRAVALVLTTICGVALAARFRWATWRRCSPRPSRSWRCCRCWPPCWSRRSGG